MAKVTTPSNRRYRVHPLDQVFAVWDDAQGEYLPGEFEFYSDAENWARTLNGQASVLAQTIDIHWSPVVTAAVLVQKS